MRLVITVSLKHVTRTRSWGNAGRHTLKLWFRCLVSAWRAVCVPPVRRRTSLRRGEVDEHAFDAQVGLDGLAPQVLADARLVIAAGGDDEVRCAPVPVDPDGAGGDAAHRAQCPPDVGRV